MAEPLEERRLMAVTGTVWAAGNIAEGTQFAIAMTATTDYGLHNWSVDWGDGNNCYYGANENNAYHTYPDGLAQEHITVRWYENAASGGASGGSTYTQTLDLTVQNVAPTLSFTHDITGVLLQGESVTLSATRLLDPGQDTIDHWIVSFGDGTAAERIDAQSVSNYSHQYTTYGEFNMYAIAYDEDGSYQTQVVPVTVAQVTLESFTATDESDSQSEINSDGGTTHSIGVYLDENGQGMVILSGSVSPPASRAYDRLCYEVLDSGNSVVAAGQLGSGTAAVAIGEGRYTVIAWLDDNRNFQFDHNEQAMSIGVMGAYYKLEYTDADLAGARTNNRLHIAAGGSANFFSIHESLSDNSNANKKPTCTVTTPTGAPAGGGAHADATQVNGNWRIDIATGTLAPGDYQVVVKVGGGDNEATIKVYITIP